MDNCLPNDNHAAPKAGHDNGHKISQAELQADIASAKLAYDAWKSNDPKQWDHAMDEKARILKEDPRAWKMAMKEIDADEQRQKELQAELKAEEAARAAADAAALQQQRESQPLQQVSGDAAEDMGTVVSAPEAVAHPGYAPHCPFSPETPNSPAFDAAYNQPPAKFYGLNAGLFKIGVTNHGSIAAGVNIGIARADVQVGLENRVEGEFMPVGGPLHARAGAGIGVNRNGFHSEVGAGANVFNLVGGDADLGARLGKDIGVDADVRGRALLLNGQGDAGVSLGENGLAVHGGGNADILNTLGARAGGRASLGPDTGLAAGVGLKAGEDTLDFGPSIDSYSDGTVSSGLHLDPSKADNATFYPTGDRTVDGK